MKKHAITLRYICTYQQGPRTSKGLAHYKLSYFKVCIQLTFTAESRVLMKS